MKVNLFPHPKQSVLVKVNPTQPNETASSNRSFTLLESVPQGTVPWSDPKRAFSRVAFPLCSGSICVCLPFVVVLTRWHWRSVAVQL